MLNRIFLQRTSSCSSDYFSAQIPYEGKADCFSGELFGDYGLLSFLLSRIIQLCIFHLIQIDVEIVLEVDFEDDTQKEAQNNRETKTEEATELSIHQVPYSFSQYLGRCFYLLLAEDINLPARVGLFYHCSEERIVDFRRILHACKVF